MARKKTPQSDTKAAEAAPEQSFDEILSQLQATVEQLEQADLPLEKSLEAFERGVGLSRRGQAILDAAEKKVEILLRDGGTEALDV